MPQLCACLKIRDTPPILERKWWFTSNFSGILFEDTPIHSSRAKAWLLGPAPIRWLDTTAPAMGSPKKPWTLFTGCGNMANVGKTIPQTTPLGIVYTIYKNGDLGDGLLYGIVSPCFTHIIGIYRTLQDTSGFYRFFFGTSKLKTIGTSLNNMMASFYPDRLHCWTLGISFPEEKVRSQLAPLLLEWINAGKKTMKHNL